MSVVDVLIPEVTFKDLMSNFCDHSSWVCNRSTFKSGNPIKSNSLLSGKNIFLTIFIICILLVPLYPWYPPVTMAWQWKMDLLKMYSLFKKNGISIAMLVYWRVPHTKKKVLLKTGQMAACAVAGASPVHMKIRKPRRCNWVTSIFGGQWSHGKTPPPRRRGYIYIYICIYTIWLRPYTQFDYIMPS